MCCWKIISFKKVTVEKQRKTAIFAMKIVVFLILGLKFRHNMLQLLHKCYKKQAKNVKQGWKVSIL